MQRMGMVIGLKPEKIAEYKRLHADAWPDILDMISKCNIATTRSSSRNRRTFCSATGNITARISRPMRQRWAADPRTQEWWDVCMPCQTPLETRKDGEWWAMMEEVFHHD
jgi:L-rhamnose mutarotase